MLRGRKNALRTTNIENDGIGSIMRGRGDGLHDSVEITLFFASGSFTDLCVRSAGQQETYKRTKEDSWQ